MFSANLVLRNDNLCRVGITGLRERVVKDTDGAYNGANALYLVLCIGRITDDLLGTDYFVTGADTNNLTIFVDKFISVLVQHVGTTVNSTQTKIITV
jgi:hypothetical protein